MLLSHPFIHGLHGPRFPSVDLDPMSVSSGHHNKIPYTSGLSNRNLLSQVLEIGKSQVKVQRDSVPGESSLPGLKTAAFLLSLR